MPRSTKTMKIKSTQNFQASVLSYLYAFSCLSSSAYLCERCCVSMYCHFYVACFVSKRCSIVVKYLLVLQHCCIVLELLDGICDIFMWVLHVVFYVIN